MTITEDLLLKGYKLAKCDIIDQTYNARKKYKKSLVELDFQGKKK